MKPKLKLLGTYEYLDRHRIKTYEKRMGYSEPLETITEPYDALRDGLIWGRWVSGEHLMPQHLATELGCTKAALREALLRLVGEGFVDTIKHQGFRATQHSEETFRQAAHLRQVLECEGAALSLQSGDFNWEMALNAAHHNLAYIEDQMAQAENVGPFIKRWSRQDWLFHSTLLSGCGSNMLLQAYKSAYDTFRMFAVSQIRESGFSPMTRSEHEAMYNAAIARDAPALDAAIRAHLTLYDDNNRLPNRRTEKGKNE